MEAKNFTFRITQPLVAFYEAEVSIEADSEEEARELLKNMGTSEIEKIAYDWTQNTDNAQSNGEITIEELTNSDND
jgi:hypothetical protein